jgi:F0F1-type ATP synthase membrane subunit b/b'
MEIALVVELISTLGFPIALVIALGWFVFRIYKASEAREAELRAEIKENQEINKESIKILTLYTERLDTMQGDIKDIKTDIGIILNDKNQ